MHQLIRVGSTVLYLTIVGEVPQGFVSRVLGELVEVYRLFGEGPELVEVYIYMALKNLCTFTCFQKH